MCIRDRLIICQLCDLLYSRTKGEKYGRLDFVLCVLCFCEIVSAENNIIFFATLVLLLGYLLSFFRRKKSLLIMSFFLAFLAAVSKFGVVLTSSNEELKLVTCTRPEVRAVSSDGSYTLLTAVTQSSDWIKIDYYIEEPHGFLLRRYEIRQAELSQYGFNLAQVPST